MNVTRVTVAGSAARSIANVQAAAARLAAAQNQLSSGRRITTSSDDPQGTVTALGLRSALARSSQYGDASTDAIAWLSTADSAYSQSVSVLQSARTLVVQALNDGASDSTSRDAIAQQLAALRSTMLTLANSSYDGRPVFGGTTATPVAYDSSGAYVGDTGDVVRAVAAQTTVTVSTAGPAVFGDPASGTDVFALLDDLSTTLRSGSGTLPDSALAQLDAAIDRISTAQAAAGSTYQQVQRVQTGRTASDASLTSRLGDVEQVDLADAALRLAAANTAYQAALQTTASVSRLSLLDFLQ